MKRRDFLQTTAATLTLSFSSALPADEGKENKPRVMTGLGESAADQLGTMLPHEPVLVDFIGADEVSPERYDADEAFRVMLPHLVQNMKRAGLLDRVLLSHDAGWYSVGEPRGGAVRGYDTMFTQFLPALQKAGLSREEIHLLTVTSPARAFAIRTRLG